MADNLRSEARLSIDDLATVRRLVYRARTKWYDIGLELELPVDELDAIKQSRDDLGDHLRDVLKYWLKRADPAPTIKALVDALKSFPVGESRLACDVEDKLHSLPNSPSFDKSTHTPLVPSRQCSLPLWIKVVIIFGLIFPVALFLNFHSDYIHTLLRRVMYHMNLLDSRSLPFLDHKVFVGREQSEIQIIQEIYKPHPPIISIVGPPGFGKSTLAIHIGHAMVADGFVVNYVDMSEVSSKQALAEKILAGDSGIVAIKNVTVERLYKWARGLTHRTLLILDNCDIILHNTTDLQTVVEKLLDNSPRLKILITSRRTILQIIPQWTYRLGNLSSEESCTLLQRVTHFEGLNSTTCKSIASLTGNVPLALQVVGAILNDINSPDVMTIVRNLEQDLIPTLSPEDLPVEERVNASINLSYQYLTLQLQKIGRQVANFPGSFDEEAACSILTSSTSSTDTCSEIAKYLEDLVRRSLLEYDRRRNRYQFHTLIREFSLAVSKEASGGKETNHFLFHFQSFYTFALLYLTKQFIDNHVQALTKLDVERHNILHLLEYLGDPSPMMDDTSDLLNAVWTVRFSFDNSFLTCRFTSRELLGPVSGIVGRLSQNLNLLMKERISVKYFENHVRMIIYLADLEKEVNGTSKAVQIFTSEEHIVGAMEQEHSNDSEVLDDVMLFYRKLSHSYFLLEDHDKVKESHGKILRLMGKLLAECEAGKCQYADIGRAYYSMNDYTSSARFFQLALDLDGEKMTEMARINLMALLYFSYYIVHDTVMATSIFENLTALLPVVKAKPEAEIYRFSFVVTTLIDIYQINNKFEEVGHLKDKLIKAMRQVGAEPTEDTMRKTQELAVYLFKAHDYQQAAGLAEFALQSLQRLNNKDQLEWELAQVQVTVGLAKFMTWNFSEGLDYMELAADYTCEQNSKSWPNPSFTDWQITVCFALRGHLCPLQNMLRINILPYVVRIIGVIFGTLLDVNTVGKYPIQKSEVENQVLSPSTQMVMATKDIDHVLPFMISASHSFTSWLSVHISTCVPTFLKSVCIWVSIFIINVTYVMEKIFLVSCLVYFLWYCVSHTLHYCRECIKFMVCVVISYAVHMYHPLNFMILHVLSSNIIPWLFLLMCACLSFLSIWIKINTLVFSMAMTILLSCFFLWHCKTSIMHYCKLFVYMCDSILPCLDSFSVHFVSVSVVNVSMFLVLGGNAFGIFVVNNLNEVLVLKIILLGFTIFCTFHRVINYYY